MNAAIGNDVSKPWLYARFDRHHFQRSFWLGAYGVLAILAFAPPAGVNFVSDASAKAKPHKNKPAKRSAARKVAPKTKVAITSPAALPVPAAIAQPQPAPHPLKVLSRDEILASDAGRLARIGRHIIAGYHDFSAIKTLVEKQAVTGIFITDHNVRGRTAAEIKSSIDQLQAIRASQDLPPLVIAADQEGGQVSRLSPPLKRQTSLARVLAKFDSDEARRKAVEDYAEIQAQELNRIGVTLNFGPVVDLNLALDNRRDGETHLRLRAIAADPYLVAKVAGWYCDTLAKSAIMCTLKHFPGLGRVARDTHIATGEISASEGLLELNDWVPFRRIMHKPNVATMLGHVRIGVIDQSTPASYSKPVISGLIRSRWDYTGLLVTDDFSMGAITGSSDGIGGAAIKALNAGADFLLVSFSEQHYDTMLSALLEADADGTLDQSALAATITRSQARRTLVPGNAP